MMLMMEMLTLNQDTRSVMRTGILAANTTIWQHQWLGTDLNSFTMSFQTRKIWQTGSDMINFIVSLSKHIHKLTNKLDWDFLFLSNNACPTLVVFDIALASFYILDDKE